MFAVYCPADRPEANVTQEQVSQHCNSANQNVLEHKQSIIQTDGHCSDGDHQSLFLAATSGTLPCGITRVPTMTQPSSPILIPSEKSYDPGPLQNT